MAGPGKLSALQIAVAEIFFGLDEAAGFLVAGGAALVASDLIERPTEDIDLFTAAPTTSVAAASQALQAESALHRPVSVVARTLQGVAGSNPVSPTERRWLEAAADLRKRARRSTDRRA